MPSLRPLLDAAELMGIDPRHALACRRRYLTERLWAASEAFERWDGGECISTEDFRLVLAQRGMKRELKQVERILRKDDRGDISDADIQAAREYPIEQVVDFVNGKALAFCHEDSNPSLTHNKKANRCHCFVCGKSFNAIDVLVSRDNYTFIGAVRALREER